MWMRNERMRGVMARSRLARRVMMGTQNRLQMGLLSGHKCPTVISTIRRARAGTEALLSADECFVLHSVARAQAALDGDFAEFGVYEGASARLLCEVKGDRTLHLFDTFEGLPTPGREEGRVFAAGHFRSRLEQVRDKLDAFSGCRFHKGFFPASAEPLAAHRFSFVHLDVDLEDSTYEGLAFFYERMVPGGIILTHDYSIIPGVARAFGRFLADKPERVIELPTTQAILVRRA